MALLAAEASLADDGGPKWVQRSVTFRDNRVGRAPRAYRYE